MLRRVGLLALLVVLVAATVGGAGGATGEGEGSSRDAISASAGGHDGSAVVIRRDTVVARALHQRVTRVGGLATLALVLALTIMVDAPRRRRPLDRRAPSVLLPSGDSMRGPPAPQLIPA